MEVFTFDFDELKYIYFKKKIRNTYFFVREKMQHSFEENRFFVFKANIVETRDASIIKLDIGYPGKECNIGYPGRQFFESNI